MALDSRHPSGAHNLEEAPRLGGKKEMYTPANIFGGRGGQDKQIGDMPGGLFLKVDVSRPRSSELRSRIWQNVM